MIRDIGYEPRIPIRLADFGDPSIREHLIQMKQAAGRPQDLADVEVLAEIQQILAEDDTKESRPDATGHGSQQ